MPQGPPIRVVLLDDHEMLRDALRALLEPVPDVEVVGQARDGDAGLALVQELVPDVLVTNIKMPGPDGIEVIRRLRRAGSPTKCLVLSMLSHARYAASALLAGAAGFVPKTATEGELVDAIRRVQSGDVLLSETFLRAVDRWQQEPGRHELALVACLAQGMSLLEAARSLGIPEATAATLRARFCRSMGEVV